ncbi:hypothetical protein PC9H_006964 [Pleurotus ostreatus]|uniref:Hydrophobin n=1 Tax=Pleurotus ostreatus TaxID=5322 RepID=A0A8H6ZYK6_PLEOS|nr:uncharacterized protein PC9H_006964 [Pleurotus ostreatus]KAF7431242.1 hypothetical protein PC9H_006964 [Pleurotus ostreatus]KAJ8695705.1 hypothetical protein PTI98_008279 [Pleurotus ostreatus]
MFFNAATFATVALATYAAATPAVVARTEPHPSSSNCGTTTIECCKDVGTATSLESPLKSAFIQHGLVSSLLVALGVVKVVDVVLGVVVDPNVVLGLTCSTVAVGGSCNAQQVCCENVAFNGLVNVGCTAIDIL